MSSASSSDISPVHGSGWNVAAESIHPLYNLHIAPEEVVLTFDLPYVDQKRVKLRCPTDDSFEVYAETSKKISFKDLGAKHRHGAFTSYRATVHIPVRVNRKRISSELKRGILEVHIPRLRPG